MSRLAFCSGIVAGVLVLSLTAAAHEPTSDPRAFGGVMPRLSSDGESIALSYQGAIWRIPRSGGSLVRLTRGRGFDVEPAWTRDGQRIAFINGMSFGSGTLAVIDSRSGEPVKLPRELAVMDKLHFDQAGRRVLGLFQPPGEKVRLAWFDLESGELTSALPAESWPGHSPGTAGIARHRFSLSHDNRWLAVVRVADEPGEQTGNRGPQCELWRVPLEAGDGDGEGKPVLIANWPARIHNLCWRADDRALFIETERGGVHLDLWEVPLERAEAGARKLTFGQADESSPSVSADGRWLLYTDNRHGSTMLMLRDLANGQEQIVAPSGWDFGSPAGWVELKLSTGPAAAETTARIVLRHSDGKYHAPPGALYRVLGADMHFYLHDQQRIEVPAGEYTVVAAHGPEHRSVRQTLNIRAGDTTSVLLHLERWTNQRSQGWVSGENHIHANYGYGHWYNSPATMKLQCEGEDLTVANFMVANSDGDGVFDREFFLGRPDPLSTDGTILYWNEEFRSTIWGHMTLLNLQHLVSPIFTGFARTTHPYDVPTNADIADHTHEQGGHVNYTHPAHNLQDPYLGAYSAKEMPVDVALGKIDSIDIMGTGHEANLPVWYRLLNCGLRVPASAGTDCFLNRIVSRLPGSDRVYVHCPEPFSYRDWIGNLRAGRSFVTNGPMLRFTVEGQEAGAAVKLPAAGAVVVAAEAEAQFPLEKLEVLVGGRPVAEALPAADSRRISWSEKVVIDRSGWIAVRVKGPRAPGQQSAESFAHTSPVYIEVAERPIRSPEDAAYFIQWIQRLRNDVRQRNRIPAAQQVHVEQQMSQALEFYGRLAKLPSSQEPN